MYKVVSWGNIYDIDLRDEKYESGGLAIVADFIDPEYGCIMPFAVLTVNLKNNLPEDHAFVDVNNCPWAEEFISRYGLGVNTGKVGRSGFCTYPLYKFNLEKIGEGS